MLAFGANLVYFPLFHSLAQTCLLLLTWHTCPQWARTNRESFDVMFAHSAAYLRRKSRQYQRVVVARAYAHPQPHKTDPAGPDGGLRPPPHASCE